MTDVERFVLLLSALMAADCGLTLLAVGVNELAPICALCGGLPAFLLIKGVVAVGCLLGLFWKGRTPPALPLVVLFAVILLLGLARK